MQVKKAKMAPVVASKRTEDFTTTAFKVAIEKVQQTALLQAKQRVPTPEEQLALLRVKQGKKQRGMLDQSLVSFLFLNL